MTSDAREVSAVIDPFAVTRSGTYDDGLVVVRAANGVQPGRAPDTVRTEHFEVTHDGGRILVAHSLPENRIDDDLAGLLADELFGPGWLRGPELFERIFTGIVRSSTADPLASWEAFYRNTLRRIDEVAVTTPAPGAHGTVAGYAPIFRRAIELLRGGSVLELGCCFGFLALRVAASGRRTTASDVSPGTVRLLAAVAPRLGVALTTRVADAARFPASADDADTVLVIHLLEHLDPGHGDLVVAEAVRLATRRVVIAVPLEDEADDTWGHVRTVSLADLAAWGRATGLPHEVHEYHGGWLVIDTGAR